MPTEIKSSDPGNTRMRRADRAESSSRRQALVRRTRFFEASAECATLAGLRVARALTCAFTVTYSADMINPAMPQDLFCDLSSDAILVEQ